MQYPLYRNVVQSSHPNVARVEQAIADCLERARRTFGDKVVDKVNRYVIEYFHNGAHAALAAALRLPEETVGVLQLSLYYIRKRCFSVIKQIIPHELAHLICMANGWEMAHGRVWRQICKVLGGTGEEFHNFAAVDGRFRYMYEAVTACGVSVWVTPTEKRRMLTEGLGGSFTDGRTFTLTAASLTGNMRPI
jgi:predicted SprT family Zn-dependent metalloprotease